MVKNFGLLGITLLVSCSSPDISTLGEKTKNLYQKLTYPSSQWSANDFGVELSSIDKSICVKHLPILIIAPKGLIPIDFYKDYLPNTTAYNDNGERIYNPPSRKQLKSIERKIGYYLDLRDNVHWKIGVDKEISSVIYCTVHEETLYSAAIFSKRYAVKTKIIAYRAVFPVSGLPKYLGGLKTGLVGVLGQRKNWHELDIHGAIFIIVDKKTATPLVLVLSQHNHFRSYIFGKDIRSMNITKLCVSYALDSNEPYLCPDFKVKKPLAVPTSGDPTKLKFIFQNAGRPFVGAHDLVYGKGGGGVSLKVRLLYLADRDPLLTSWIPLGEKKKVMGIMSSVSRTGPPGMLINTWPGLKSIAKTAQLFYFAPGDDQAFSLFIKSYKNRGKWIEKLIVHNGVHFWGALLYMMSTKGIEYSEYSTN